MICLHCFQLPLCVLYGIELNIYIYIFYVVEIIQIPILSLYGLLYLGI